MELLCINKKFVKYKDLYLFAIEYRSFLLIETGIRTLYKTLSQFINLIIIFFLQYNSMDYHYVFF